MIAVGEIMTPDPHTISPDTPLYDAVGLMKMAHCRQLPVVDGEGLIIGIITDRDVRLALSSPLTPHERLDDITLLREVTTGTCMTPDPLCVTPDTPAVEAAEVMLRHKFGALPVVDGNRKVVGIVTVSDLLGSYISVMKQYEQA
jgi:acetoin utilization protein AcuB